MPTVSSMTAVPAYAPGDAVYLVTAAGDSRKLVNLRVATIAAMQAIAVPTNGMSVEVTEDGRGGFFVFDTSATAAGNGGTTFSADDATSGSWVRQMNGSDYYPEWWGSTNTAIRDAFQSMPAGSRLVLRGELYETVAFTINNDPLAAGGADTGKRIEGAIAPQRYRTTGEFYGTRIRLANAQNADMFTVQSGGANEWGAGGLKNLMLEGNKTNNTAGAGIKILNVKDWTLENVYVWDFFGDGINLEGANNQIGMEGFIECWNNGRDGIRGAAVGDPQWNAAIRCVNNGRYGFQLATGFGRINQVYCYFNTDAGFYYTSTGNMHINYLRCEDNDKAGARITGANLHVNCGEFSDNGADSVIGTERVGVYLNGCRDVTFDYVSAINRTAAVHNQRFLVYDASAHSCQIGHINNDAYGAHAIADEQTVFVTNTVDLRAVNVGTRKTKSDTYANIKDAGASITPLPDTFGRYRVTAMSEAMTVNNPAGSRMAEGMTLEFQITSDGSYNVNWGTTFLDAAGSALSATALTAAQTAHAKFIRHGGQWYLAAPIRVV